MQEINLVMFQFSEDTPFQFYWNPMIIGETITGHIYMISTDEYGAEIIILKIKDPYYDIKYFVRIPPYPTIMGCYYNLNIGDYMEIEYIRKVPGVDCFEEKIFNTMVNGSK